MKPDQLLSVIIPVYKQEKTIQQDLERIFQTLEKTGYSFELLPVVDGTDLDNSYAQIEKLRLPNIKLLGYAVNKGKGYAVRYGMREAQGDIVTFIDAGMDIDPQGIVMLLDHMKWYEADIIIGSKLHPASIVTYPWWRRVLTYGYYFLVKLLFGLKVKDTQTGLKAYKRKVLETVLPRLLVKQFAFDIEILAVAKRLGFSKIFDAPVKVNLDQNSSSINIFGTNGAFFILVDTLAIWYRLKVLKYYDERYKQDKTYDKDLNFYVLRTRNKNKQSTESEL